MFFVPLNNNSTYYYSYDSISWITGSFPITLNSNCAVGYIKSNNTWVIHNGIDTSSNECFLSKDLVTWEYIDITSTCSNGYNNGCYYAYYRNSDNTFNLLDANCFSTTNGKDWSYYPLNTNFLHNSANNIKTCIDGSIVYSLPSNYMTSDDGCFVCWINDSGTYGSSFNSDSSDSNILALETGINDLIYVIYDTNVCTDDWGWCNDYDLYTFNKATNERTLIYNRINWYESFDENYDVQVMKNFNNKIYLLSSSSVYNLITVTTIDTNNSISIENVYDPDLQIAVSPGSGYQKNCNSCIKNDKLYFTGTGINGQTFKICSLDINHNINVCFDAGTDAIEAIGIWCN